MAFFAGPEGAAAGPRPRGCAPVSDAGFDRRYRSPRHPESAKTESADIHAQTLKALKKIDLFAELTADELALLAGRSAIQTFPGNAVVISEGDDTTSLYVLLTGRVKVFTSDDNGDEVMLNELGPHDYFGEIALIDGGPRSASVMTLATARVVVVSRELLLERIRADPAVAVALLKTVGRKLRQQTLGRKSLALMDVYQRLVGVLYDSGSEHDGQVVVEGMSRQALADRVCASRGMVTLILKELRHGGYVSADRKRIVILKRLPARW